MNINNFNNLKIAVIGDVMLDRYLHGSVNRISPEAPVPVVNIKRTREVLGGAANVAANLAGLGCNVYMGGVVGDDSNRSLLEDLMEEQGINHDGLVISPSRATITKARVLGGQQQMLRMDFEEIGDLTSEEASSLKCWLRSLFEQKLDGIIISDYAKGVCSDEFCQWIIRKSKEYNVSVLVDPKGREWDKYCGCTYITPNLKELSDVIGYACENLDKKVEKAATVIQEKYNIENVVATRSEKGITVVNESKIIHEPATAKEVFDVSGAGDTVAATFLSCVVSGFNLEEAVKMANLAAGIVVNKVGTYPIHKDELEAIL